MANDILKNIWPEWKIVKEIGRGSYGVVYEAVRLDYSIESYAAIKVISIPRSASDLDALHSEGLTVNEIRFYLEEVVNNFAKEIKVMESLKGVQNIVSIEDYRVVERTDRIGWDIFIRMELLTPLKQYSRGETLTEQRVIELGIDICNALTLCARNNVVHRDIKPENIFVNKYGDFKLGDFGIARKLENVTTAMSHKGTTDYMAPEVAKGMQYDATVDLYSLGLVLYQYMNRNRLPFIKNEQPTKHSDRMEAMRRRLRGEPLPTPCDASSALAQVILKACAYDPHDRFSSAAEMKEALESVSRGSSNRGSSSGGNGGGGNGSKRSNRYTPPVVKLPSKPPAGSGVVFTDGEVNTPAAEKKQDTAVVAIIVVVVLIAIVGLGIIVTRFSRGSSDEAETLVLSGTETPASSETVTQDMSEAETYAPSEAETQDLSEAEAYVPYEAETQVLSLLASERQVLHYGGDRMQYVTTYTWDSETLTLTGVYGEGYIESVDIYDEYGNILSSDSYGDFGTVTSSVEYVYDDDGNLLEDQTIFYNDDGTVNSMTLRDYIYTDSGYVIVVYWCDEDGNVYMQEREYDEDGNEVRYTSYDSDGTVMYAGSYGYEYDENGNATQIVYYDADGSIMFVDEYEYKYRYDENGNVIAAFSYDYERILYAGEYELNQEGNLIKYTVSSYDENGNVDYKEILEFNDDGNILRSTEYYYYYEEDAFSDPYGFVEVDCEYQLVEFKSYG